MNERELRTQLQNCAKQFDKEIDKALKVCENKKLENAMRHIPLAGGKRLRPALAMFVADAINNSGMKTIPFGTALELLHNFTLVHDDIMDNDQTRRGVKTVHMLYGLPTAINAGDALFARAYELLATLDVSGEVLRKLLHQFSSTIRRIAEGQQWDMDFEHTIPISEAEYLKMIEYKTAMLFSLAAEGGAMIAGGSEKQIKAMAEYGRLIGLGFQIRDDVLDLIGDPKERGKPYGSDIKNGKRTLMVIHAMENLVGEERDQFFSVLGNRTATESDVMRAIAILVSSGAIVYAKKTAERFANQAEKMLDVLPESRHKELLHSLIEYMIRREK